MDRWVIVTLCWDNGSEWNRLRPITLAIVIKFALKCQEVLKLSRGEVPRHVLCQPMITGWGLHPPVLSANLPVISELDISCPCATIARLRRGLHEKIVAEG
jgi:hypothetical protein